MSYIHSSLVKNGEILDLLAIDNNNYLISINIGNQRNKISNYLHIRTSPKGIKIINKDLGNKVIRNIQKKILIIRNSKNGYFLYDIDKGERTSMFFDNMKFIEIDGETYIYVSDNLRNRIGNIYIKLGALLNDNGQFISDILNITNNIKYDDISNQEEYIKLKEKITEEIDNIYIDEQEVCKKLLKRGE